MKYHAIYEITENEKNLLEEFRQSLESDDYYDRYWTGKKINILGRNISPGYFEINGWFGWVRCTFNYAMFRLDGSRLEIYCEGARNSIVEIVPQFLHEKLPVEVIYYESYNTNVSPFETHVDLFAYFSGTKTFNDIYERVKNLYVVHGENWFSLNLDDLKMKAMIKKDENEYNLDVIIGKVLYSFVVKRSGYEKFRSLIDEFKLITTYLPYERTQKDIYEKVDDLYYIYGDEEFVMRINDVPVFTKLIEIENGYKINFHVIHKSSAEIDYKFEITPESLKQPEQSCDFYYRKDKLLPWLNQEV